MSHELEALNLKHLTSQEETYVLYRIRGINPKAAARSAGYPVPERAVADLGMREDITRAIAYGREMARQSALNAGALEFTRDDATRLYLEAHAKSATALEEIRAIDSLVKLHGLATPEKVEVSITRRDQLQQLDDEKLLEIAGQDITLNPEDYVEIVE